MTDLQWRVVDSPLLQPRDPQSIVFADWGPWCADLSIAKRNAQWLENTGRQVWIEGPGKTWMDSRGFPTQGPPPHYRRRPKGIL